MIWIYVAAYAAIGYLWAIFFSKKILDNGYRDSPRRKVYGIELLIFMLLWPPMMFIIIFANMVVGIATTLNKFNIHRLFFLGD